MERVLATVKRSNEARVRDLDLPADLPAGQLSAEIARVLGWSPDPDGKEVAYDIDAHPPGRLLQPGETLAQVDAWDGSWLVFYPKGTAPKPQPPSPMPPPAPQLTVPGSPIAGWRKLDIPPQPPAAGMEKPPDSTGYSWKQLDED